MTEHSWSGKRLLLLSGPMGTGHVQASRALERAAAERYPDLKVTHWNVAELMTPGLRCFFTNIYHAILRHAPGLWYYMYISSNVPQQRQPLFRRVMVVWRRRFEQRLAAKIAELQPDFIICTHFMPGEIIGAWKQEGKFPIPTATVVTDFSLHWAYIQPQIELFFVANHDMSLLMHLRGIDREKIYITGCPIFPGFGRKYTVEEKQQLRRELGLPEDRPFIMVMMGGENIGRLREISEAVLNYFPKVAVLAMTGKSVRVLEQMQQLKDKKYPDRLFPVGYTERVRDYMAVSYLVITKPGGITVSECVAMRLPIIVMDPIRGHEEKNANYLATHGLAAFAEELEDLKYMDIEPGATWMQMVSNYQETYHVSESSFNILKVVIEWEGNNRED